MGGTGGEEASAPTPDAVPAASAAFGADGRVRRVSPAWRRLEWWGVGVALFLFSGAVVQVALAPDGLTPSAKSALRLVPLPAYAITVALLWRHASALGVALLRSWPVVALLAFSVLSVTWSLSGSVSLRRAFGLILTSALAYLIAIRFTPRQFLVLISWVIGACMVMSLVLAVASPRHAMMPAHDAAQGLRGVFIHKNVLGWYAAVAVLTGLSLLLERAAPRWAALGLLAAGLACLAAAGSATGVIAATSVVLLTLFYLLLSRLRGPARSLLVLLAVQVAAVALIGFGAIVAPALETLGRDPTLTGRTPLWALVDELIGRRLFLGFGYQAFWTEANPDAWWVWARAGWAAPHAHNGYRDVLLNFGMIGFAIFAFVLLRAMIQGAALHCRSPREGWLWLNVLLVMCLVMNCTESFFLVQNELLSMLVTTAIVMFAVREPQCDARQSSPEPRRPGAWPALAAAAPGVSR